MAAAAVFTGGIAYLTGRMTFSQGAVFGATGVACGQFGLLGFPIQILATEAIFKAYAEKFAPLPTRRDLLIVMGVQCAIALAIAAIALAIQSEQRQRNIRTQWKSPGF